MCENLRELSESLENIDRNLDILLLTLNSPENIITFGNHAGISADVNINEHRVILSVENLNFIESENAIGEEGTLYIGDFIFENSFISDCNLTPNRTQFTLVTNNISYRNNDKTSFNIAIWRKPQQLNRLDSYINDNVNVAFCVLHYMR